MLLGDDDPANGRWGTRNRVLAAALTIFDSMICGGCGQPSHESVDPDGPDYSAEDHLCRACAVLTEAPSENDEPGTKWGVSVTRYGARG